MDPLSSIISSCNSEPVLKLRAPNRGRRPGKQQTFRSGAVLYSISNGVMSSSNSFKYPHHRGTGKWQQGKDPSAGSLGRQDDFSD